MLQTVLAVSFILSTYPLYVSPCSVSSTNINITDLANLRVALKSELNADKIAAFDYRKLLPASAWRGTEEPDTSDNGAYTVLTNAGEVRIPAAHSKPSNGSSGFKVYRRDGLEPELIKFREPPESDSSWWWPSAKPTTTGSADAQEPPPKQQVFHLFNLTQVSKADFDPSKRTLVVIHGYRTKGIVEWMVNMKDAWLQLDGDSNVVLVDWSEWVSRFYYSAVAGTHVAARQLVVFLYYLAESHGASFESANFRSRLYFVGHSLGAHVAGYAGKELRGEVGRITGLDPAGPSFDDGLEAREHLFRTDARLVDIIHTNSGDFRKQTRSFFKAAWRDWRDKRRMIDIDEVDDAGKEPTTPKANDSVFWGLARDMGHVDYYANDGAMQPGCFEFKSFCDHSRAIDLWQSIVSFALAARRSGESLGSKLLAFKARSYTQFRSGESLGAGLVDHQLHLLLPLSDNNATQTSSVLAASELKRFALALDVTLTAEEFYALHPEVSAYWAKNGGKVLKDRKAPKSDDTEAIGVRAFFDTLAKPPFVGFQYLLKLHLAHDSSSSQPSSACKLAVISENTAQHTKAPLIVNPIYQYNDSARFYGHAVPLNLITDYMTFFSVEAAVEELRRELNGAAATRDDLFGMRVGDQLERIFPTSIRMAVYSESPVWKNAKAGDEASAPAGTTQQPPTTTPMTTQGDEWDNFHFTDPPSTSAPWWWQRTTPTTPTMPSPDDDYCTQSITAIEVRPISFYNFNASAWYLSSAKGSWSLVYLRTGADEHELIAGNSSHKINRSFRMFEPGKFLFGSVRSALKAVTM